MLLTLHGRHLTALGPASERPFIGRLCERLDVPMDERRTEILLVDAPCSEPPDGFRAVLVRHGNVTADRPDVYRLGNEFAYLAEGDIVRIEPAGRSLSTLYRRAAVTNSILVTERCDNYCVMCSQPPRDVLDGHLVDELLEAIPWMSTETREIGFTGGEPALLGERLVELVVAARDHLPKTAVHILSNGRAFAQPALARALALARHPDLMIGIPLYSAVPEVHDYVVQAQGAFNETVRGILNLKARGVRVELRFVIHRDTYKELPDFAHFVARNLLFVDHVALMGLELMGFARSNLDALWIDPLDYHPELASAVLVLDRAGLLVSIYNHQLCVLPPELHDFARPSISDWKNRYFDECEVCSKRSECGGFFASSTLRRSRGIRPI